MPWPEVVEQLEYWAEYPPMHLLMRAYVGYKPPSPEDIERENAAGMAALGLRPGAKVPKLSKAPAYLQAAAKQLKESLAEIAKEDGRN